MKSLIKVRIELLLACTICPIFHVFQGIEAFIISAIRSRLTDVVYAI